MRIVGGSLRGRRLDPPKLVPTRPTTDFAREGLMNILNNYLDFEAVSFLDLFAGTGAFAFEFASRGCTDITCVDSHHACVKFIKQKAAEFKVESSIQAFRLDVFRYIETAHRQYDVVFADPPYEMENVHLLPDIVAGEGLLSENGWFILEHNPQHDFTQHPSFFHERKYGGTIFSFFRAGE